MDPTKRQRIVNYIWLCVFIAAGAGLMWLAVSVIRSFIRVILEIR